ncbi:MAG TPA: FAD-dependent oxidoreductase [Rhodanobacteraceae bacterium]|nr:FAD-dependent oxidoreductase [Rhodanobacteraceae bacterium]
MIPPRSDVLVLGAGVIGLSCALYLLKAGASVRLLEKGHAGCGSSHGNCGTLTPSHADPLAMPGMIGKAMRWMVKRDAPLYVSPRPDLARLRWLLGFARRCNWRDFTHTAEARAAMLLRSRDLIEALVRDERLDCEFDAAGTLYVYRDARAMAADAAHIEWMQRLGIATEVKHADDVAAMEPALLPGMAGGVYHPGDARLRPDRYVAELARRVRELGGIIEEQAPIHGFATADSRLTGVRTARGEFAGERVVLALGAWSPLVGEALRLRLPMQPGKGYSITWSRPALCPRLPLTLHEDSVCVTAWGSGFRLGSTMEFAGYDTRLNRLRLDALKRGAARYLRQPEGGELHEEWWGWRPMSVDELPIIGPSARWSNLILATGHGMMGMSMSAATAELVAAQAAGQPPPLDPAPYAPARFAL